MNVSVVIPTYNRGAWLIEAIDSVRAQTLPAFEIVVVDDGSTDDTPDRLRQYLERHPGAFVSLRTANRGVGAARNAGIARCTGDAIGFLDSDDRWEPPTIERIVAAWAGRPEVGLVAIKARETLADGRPTSVVYGKNSPGDTFTTESLLAQDAGGCSWFFVRREIVEQVGGFDETLASAEECDLVLRLSFVTQLRAVCEPLLLRRRHSSNLSGDQRANAEAWLQLLARLARDQPGWVAGHRRVYRRALSKEQLRVGREYLAVADGDPDAAARARQWILRSLRTSPRLRRGLTYLAWASIAPASYPRWRARQLRARASRELLGEGPR